MSKQEESAFIEALKVEMEGAMKHVTNEVWRTWLAQSGQQHREPPTEAELKLWADEALRRGEAAAQLLMTEYRHPTRHTFTIVEARRALGVGGFDYEEYSEIAQELADYKAEIVQKFRDIRDLDTIVTCAQLEALLLELK